MSARSDIEAEITSLRVTPVAPGLVSVALALAAQLDDAHNGTSAANVARVLLETMDKLRALAPLQAHDDALDELTKKRESRRRRSGTEG